MWIRRDVFLSLLFVLLPRSATWPRMLAGWWCLCCLCLLFAVLVPCRRRCYRRCCHCPWRRFRCCVGCLCILSTGARLRRCRRCFRSRSLRRIRWTGVCDMMNVLFLCVCRFFFRYIGWMGALVCVDAGWSRRGRCWWRMLCAYFECVLVCMLARGRLPPRVILCLLL